MSIKRFVIAVTSCTIFVLSGFAYGLQPTAAGNMTVQNAASHEAKLVKAGATANPEVTMNVQGPVVANEMYTSSTIAISPSHRNLNVYSTYANNLIFSQSLDNNAEAYTQFWNALQDAGFGIRSTNSIGSNVNSTCATGLRYTYTVLDNGQTTGQSWTTSCGSSSSNFSGSAARVNRLFQQQIPKLHQMLPYQPFL